MQGDAAPKHPGMMNRILADYGTAIEVDDLAGAIAQQFGGAMGLATDMRAVFQESNRSTQTTILKMAVDVTLERARQRQKIREDFDKLSDEELKDETLREMERLKELQEKKRTQDAGPSLEGTGGRSELSSAAGNPEGNQGAG